MILSKTIPMIPIVPMIMAVMMTPVISTMDPTTLPTIPMMTR